MQRNLILEGTGEKERQAQRERERGGERERENLIWKMMQSVTDISLHCPSFNWTTNTALFLLAHAIIRLSYLTQVHDHALVDFLPQVSTENLDEGDLQSRNLAVHEDSSQVQLHLETHVHLFKTTENWSIQQVAWRKPRHQYSKMQEVSHLKRNSELMSKKELRKDASHYVHWNQKK